MATALADLFWQSPEVRRQKDQHREEMARIGVEKRKAEAEKLRALRGNGRGDEGDGGRGEDPRVAAMLANMPAKEDDDMGDYIEEHPVITGGLVVGGLALVTKLLKLW